VAKSTCTWRPLAADSRTRKLAGFFSTAALGAMSARWRGAAFLPDALIAATALVHRLALVTRNRRDFERVRG